MVDFETFNLFLNLVGDSCVASVEVIERAARVLHDVQLRGSSVDIPGAILLRGQSDYFVTEHRNLPM